MNPTVICFAGRIASGKSSVSTAFADRFGWRYASFGKYVREVAQSKGHDISDRSVLQTLGANLIDELGWETFCWNVLLSAGWKDGEPLVVDGVRHIEAYRAITTLVAPSLAVLAFLDVEDGLLDSRRQVRGLSPDEGRLETHSTEIQVVRSLPDIAELRLNAGRPVEEIVADIAARIGL